MQFIRHNEIKPGDRIVYPIGTGALIYYEVLRIKFSANTGTIICGRSFGPYGQRWNGKSVDREEDLIPNTRDVFLISRTGGIQ